MKGLEAYYVKERVKRESGRYRWSERIKGGGSGFGLIDFRMRTNVTVNG